MKDFFDIFLLAALTFILNIMIWETSKWVWRRLQILRRETIVMRKGDAKVTVRGEGKEHIRQMLLTQGYR